MPLTVAALITTKARDELLLQRSLPSVLAQNRPPELIIIVNDGPALDERTQAAIHAACTPQGLEFELLHNARAPGAGGAWNTGLAQLRTLGHEGFVAVLDDDDTWDTNHLEVNLAHAHDASIVVSGLRMMARRQFMHRPLIEALDPRTFLTGNPGWQGSNTFVSLDLLLQVGGFREGLPSLNDRDLALRLLRHPGSTWKLTGQWTATWNADTVGNLSTPGSVAKREGLRAFWSLYGAEMAPPEREAYFLRAALLFGISEPEITDREPAARPALGFPVTVDHA
jgi:glycosyltransferase involved in cell wall biosynthesis